MRIPHPDKSCENAAVVESSISRKQTTSFAGPTTSRATEGKTRGIALFRLHSCRSSYPSFRLHQFLAVLPILSAPVLRKKDGLGESGEHQIIGQKHIHKNMKLNDYEHFKKS